MLSRKHKHHGLIKIQAYQGVGLVIMGKNVHYLKLKEVYCVFIEDVDNEIKNLKQIYTVLSPF